MSCVNINSREFKTLLDEVNISSSALELIIHKIQNSENSDRFPSAEEVNNLLKPKSFTGDYNMIEVWEKQYSSPINFPTLILANEEYNNAVKIFGKDSVSIVERKNGTYDLIVGNPTFESEYKYILSNAKRDSEGNLLAPNGKKSNLDERQYAQVRTKEFKDWFGDWENDPENASKVVDENGEPLVVYHGTTTPNITKFDINKTISGRAFWFANKEAQKAVMYSGQYDENLILMPLFVNMKSPLLNQDDSMEDYASDETHDGGLILGRLKDFKGIMSETEYKEILDNGLNDDSYLATGNVSNPNQLKSATSNIGEFSTTNDDIRYSSITEQPIKVPSVTSFAERLQVQQQPKFASLVARGEISTSCR